MRCTLKSLTKALLGLAVLAASSFVLPQLATAASVYNCSSANERCVVKVEEGIIGDHIKVLDEKARVIAVGRITKRKGAYAVVKISQNSQTIRKGDPVIVEVENRDSNLQWAASFSDKE